MIKVESSYNHHTSSWCIRNKVFCKTKHKFNRWYTVDRAKDHGEYWDLGWKRPTDVVVGPKLLTVWSK